MNGIREIQRRATAVVMLTAWVAAMSPLPTRAQIFGGIVHDPVNYALQVEKRVEPVTSGKFFLDRILDGEC